MINYRISKAGGFALVSAAILADLLSLIPLVGTVSGPLFWILASWYLWKKGCGFLNFRRFATGAISTVIEMLPAVQAFPAALLGISIVLVLIWLEDRTGISVNPKNLNVSVRRPRYTSDESGNGIRLPQTNNSALPPVLNVDGIRPPNGGLK